MARRYPKGIPKKVVRKIRKEWQDQKRAQADQGISELVSQYTTRMADLRPANAEHLVKMLNHYAKVKPFIVLVGDVSETLRDVLPNDPRFWPSADIMRAGVLDVTSLRKFCRKLRSAIPKPPRPVLEDKSP